MLRILGSARGRTGVAGVVGVAALARVATASGGETAPAPDAAAACVSLAQDELRGQSPVADPCARAATSAGVGSALAWNLYNRGCDAGDAYACIRQSAGIPGVQLWMVPDDVVEALSRGCELGSTVACLALKKDMEAWLGDLGIGDSLTAQQGACEAGDASSCTALEAAGWRSDLVRDVHWVRRPRQLRSTVPNALVFSADSSRVLLGGDPWYTIDAESGAVVRGPPVFEVRPALDVQGPDITGVTLDPRGRTLALLRDDHRETAAELGGDGVRRPRELALWDVAGANIERLDAELSTFSPDGRYLAIWRPGALHIRDLSNGRSRSTSVEGRFSALVWTAERLILASPTQRLAFDARLREAPAPVEVPCKAVTSSGRGSGTATRDQPDPSPTRQRSISTSAASRKSTPSSSPLRAEHVA